MRYRNKTIADVLDMSVTEALAFFGNIPQIKRKLQTLYDGPPPRFPAARRSA